MAPFLLGFAGFIFAFLGCAHGWLTLRDCWKPRVFTPVDDSVRLAMQSSGLRIHPAANLWQAWLGFNFSHSLGAILFGAVLLFVAATHFPDFARSRAVQAVALFVNALYVALGLRFWFWKPTLGISLALLSLLAACVLS